MSSVSSSDSQVSGADHNSAAIIPPVTIISSSPDLPLRAGTGLSSSSSSHHNHQPHYSAISETIRKISSTHLLTHSFQCAAFCGGADCKHENPSKWVPEDTGVAFNGLFCHWITDKVLAMARPSTRLFKDYDLLTQFKNADIKAVINLQTAGEHAQCGPGLEPSGYTYEPEYLMKQNIFYYNYPWPDYGSPLIPVVLAVVKVIDFSCSTGKVAIHCHSGLGRTGVVIACYLLYSQRSTPDWAITTVREKRPGSIQTRGQLELIEQFHDHLRILWCLYPPVTDMKEYLSRQSKLLHGDQEKKYKYIPKVVASICQRLSTLSIDKQFEFRCQLDDRDDKTGCHGYDHVTQSLLLCSDCRNDDVIVQAIRIIESEINSEWVWPVLDAECDPTVLFTLLFNFFTGLPHSLIKFDEEKDDLWKGLNKYQTAILKLVLNTIKTVINSYKLHDDIESICDHLSSVFLDTSSTNGAIAGRSMAEKTFVKLVSEYLNSN